MFLLFMLIIVVLAALCKVDAQYGQNQASVHFHQHDHHHPHHHHHHHLHPDEQEPEFRIDERSGDFNNGLEVKPDFNNATEIPLEFIENINKYDDINDVLRDFVNADVTTVTFQNRFGGDEERERDGAVKKAVSAKCMPELKTVEIATSDNPNIVFLPSCIRIERCGGCCSHDLLTCRPTESETVSYLVYETKFTGAQKLDYVQKKVIPVEKHTQCKCDCKIQPENCSQFQVFKQDLCRCVCSNTDEQKKCLKNTPAKLWNPNVCACQCREEKECSTGSYWDIHQCRCVTLPMRRRFVDGYPNAGYRIPGVAPL